MNSDRTPAQFVELVSAGGICSDTAMQAPPPPMPDPQAMQDAEHLRLLVIFHYVMAGLAVVGACFASLYVVMGVLFGSMVPAAATSGPSGSGMSPADADFFRMMGWLWAVIGGAMAILALGFAVCLFLCGKFLAERRNATFVFVIACVQCVNMPLGTALGVFTILILQRPSVKALFERPGGELGAYR